MHTGENATGAPHVVRMRAGIMMAFRATAFIAATTLALAGCGGGLFNGGSGFEEEDVARTNDATAPVITIAIPGDAAPYAPTVTVSGSITDSAGDGVSGRVDSASYELVGTSTAGDVTVGSDGSYTFEFLTAGITGTITLKVSATDWNGNTASAQIELVPPKEMTSFAFRAADNAALGEDAVGEIDGTSITVVIPDAADESALTATFTYNGASVELGGVAQESGVTVNDFTTPRTYRVIANDSTYRDYTVTVSSVDAKELLTYWFRAADNAALSADIQGTIATGAVMATVPFGTDVTALVAEFTTSGVSVEVGGVPQESGVTANDFTAPVAYSVIAQDDSSYEYAVTVSIGPSPENDITAFSFAAADNVGMSTDAVGTIEDGAQEIDVVVPLEADLTGLVATFSTNGQAVEVAGNPQSSGETANDFSAPLTYTVTAEDATTRDYVVYLHVAVDLVSVPAVTSFSMGFDLITGFDDNSEPIHTVPSIGAFELGTYEVTESQWSTVRHWAEDHGYAFERDVTETTGEGPSEPITAVSWYDAVAWCNALSEKEGLTPAYYTDAGHTTVYRGGSTPDLTSGMVDWAAGGYRLPTEAEWENAARFIDGSTWTDGDLHSGSNLDGDAANCAWYNHGSTEPVGELQANSLGVYDMSGNAREWCWDRYGAYTTESPYTDPDPRGPETGTERVVRGGSGFDGSSAEVDTSYRRSWEPSQPDAWNLSNYYGMRVAR